MLYHSAFANISEEMEEKVRTHIIAWDGSASISIVVDIKYPLTSGTMQEANTHEDGRQEMRYTRMSHVTISRLQYDTRV